MAGETRLSRGAHRDESAGCCLMEHVSVVAGEPFGMIPRCTHPALAGLAILVNDRVSDTARAALVSRVAALGRARSDDPALTWRLVEHAACLTLSRRPDDAGAARRVRRAARARRVRGRVLPPAVAARLPGWARTAVALLAADEVVVAVHALLAASGPPGSTSRDHALLELLDGAVALTLGDPAPALASPQEEVSTP